MYLIQTPKKSLGQNFLVDQNIIDKIIKVENIEENQTILEIGSGYGNLTKKIVETNAKKIIAIEKDKKIAKFLKDKFTNLKNVQVVNADIFDIIEKISKFGKSLNRLSLDTVRKFFLDSKKSNFKL